MDTDTNLSLEMFSVASIKLVASRRSELLRLMISHRFVEHR